MKKQNKNENYAGILIGILFAISFYLIIQDLVNTVDIINLQEQLENKADRVSNDLDGIDPRALCIIELVKPTNAIFDEYTDEDGTFYILYGVEFGFIFCKKEIGNNENCTIIPYEGGHKPDYFGLDKGQNKRIKWGSLGDTEPSDPVECRLTGGLC